MNLKKKNDPTTLIYIVIAIVAVFACKIVEFFRSTGANLKILDFIHRLIEFFEALGICIGLVILFLVCVSILAHFEREISDRSFNRILRQSREYPIRCYPVQMHKSEYGLLPEDLSKESGYETRIPIYLNHMTITN